MNLVKVALVEASDDQLRWYGENVKGLDMAGCKTRTKIMGALGPVLGDEDSIRVPEDQVPVVEQAERPVVAVDPKHDFTSVMDAPTITVKLMTNGGTIGGKDDVYVNCNSKGLRFARNMPIRMPYPFFRALQDAVCAEVTQDADGELIETDVVRYPYQILEPVDPVALAAFDAAVAKKHLYA